MKWVKDSQELVERLYVTGIGRRKFLRGCVCKLKSGDARWLSMTLRRHDTEDSCWETTSCWKTVVRARKAVESNV